MKKLAKILVVLAALCVLAALSLKVAGGGKVLPYGPMMWLKLGGLSLLFSIALSLLSGSK